ncbi:putative zinc binding dehydrogenase [Xylariales sp. AK1849]|nr:putative zinc binding dehydrogenase [Xylariales sp. AK1849]
MKVVNYAAWIQAEKARFEVATAPFPEIGEDEIIIKNKAVAVNPVDWKIQASGGFGLKYPYVFGEDVAGEIIEVGSKVKQFKPGQRVIANALGLGAGNAEYGGFQLYVRLKVATVAVIPDDLPFQSAVVLPLSISTAAAGLYLKSNLGLRYPQLNPDALAKKSALLLWGGSSSVGSSVIQLAVASGYEVITTASPANYAFVKSLGAKLVLDYHNPDIVSILIGLLKDSGSDFVGAYDAIGSEATVRQSAKIVQALGGGVVASVVSSPEDLEKDVKITRIGSSNIVTQEPEVGKKVWGEYVPAALKAGALLPKPKELVIGNGLYFVQGGLDTQRSGVSANKVVITL